MEILIDDDEPMIRKGLKTMIAQIGPPITGIHTGGERGGGLANCKMCS